eukprot:3579439-Ditylum_brightwellii.AAC.1
MQFIQCYVPSMYFHYNVGFAFPPLVQRHCGEGTCPPCISNAQDERSKSDKQCESPHAYVTQRLYVGARGAKQG